MTDENTRNALQFLRDKMALSKQATVAERTGMEKTAVNRVFNGDRGVFLDELPAFLAALGVQLADAETPLVYISRDEYAALVTMSEQGFAHYRARAKALSAAPVTGDAASGAG